jgi:hypothetical protein
MRGAIMHALKQKKVAKFTLLQRKQNTDTKSFYLVGIA